MGVLVADVLRSVNRLIHKCMLFIAQAALLSMVVIVSMVVILRYGFSTGIGWAEEVPSLLVTLFAFLAMAMGVRDHAHIAVNIVYNLFPENGAVRKFFLFFGDFVVLLCGLVMLYYGAGRCIIMFDLDGRLPMTGLSTWWQYLPVPLAGLLISFDSILFLTGVLDRNDLFFTEAEVDYAAQLKEQQLEAKESAR
jgi:TRAP-type C4-dicarboxylate transport system permease small subunit